MKIIKLVLSAVAVAAAQVAFSDIEVAEELIVDLNIASLSALADGATVSTWANSATGADKVGDFAPVTSGAGPVYRTDLNGAKGVVFSGASSVLWNSDALPATLCGNDTFTAEVWVYCSPTNTREGTYFTWTYRGGANQLLEMRYNNAGNAIEHHSNNIGWGYYGMPVRGEWHLVALTRDASGNETLYVDGVPVSEKLNYTGLSIQTGGNFHIGGVKGTNGNFDGGLFFYGAVGGVRVHAGTLSASQVANNYAEECARFQHAWNVASGNASDAANWANGMPLATNGVAVVNNGGVATIDSYLPLKELRLLDGTVEVDGGYLYMRDTQRNIVELVRGNTGTAAVNLKRGRISTIKSLRGIDSWKGDGAVTMTIGAPNAPAGSAALTIWDGYLEHTTRGVGNLVIEDGADVYVSGWIVGGRYNNEAIANITMNGGYVRANDWFMLGSNRGSGTLWMNGGHMWNGATEFTYGSNDNSAQYGIYHLNGGVFETSRFQNNYQTGTQTIYFNGGVLKARESNDNFLPASVDTCTVQGGNAIIDTSTYYMNIKCPFLVDSSDPGKIVKRGSGRINFSDNFAFDGEISIEQGSVKFNELKNLANVTKISLAKDAIVLCTANTGATALLAKIDPASEGTLMLPSQCTGESLDLTGYPNLKLAFDGNNADSFTGTFTPALTEKTIAWAVHGGNNTKNQNIVDGAVPVGLLVSGCARSRATKLELGGNNTFSGTTTVDGTMLQYNNANATGTGPIRLINGGELVLNHANLDVQGIINRLTPDSVGSLLFCNDSKKDVSFSLVGHPGIYVAAYPAHNFDYTGTITPADPGEYHFGGGQLDYNGANDGGFKYKPSASVIADGETPTKVVYGRRGYAASFSQNTYTGGTIVTNEATVYVYNNDYGFGAVPATDDPDNLYFDNGGMRVGGSDITLAATRGMTIGAGGFKAHTWGGKTCLVKGSLHGTGPIWLSDTGTFAFGGAANDYTGLVTVTSGAHMQIGCDDAFSWDFDRAMPRLVGNAGLVLHIPSGTNVNFTATVGNGDTGSSVLIKQGAGTLTLAARQNTSILAVSNGTVTASASGVMPPQVSVAAGTTLKLAAGTTHYVNSLTGNGSIEVEGEGTATLVIGDSNGNSDFAGHIDNNILIVKNGTGTATLVLDEARDTVTVNAGTMDLEIPSIVRPVVASGATLRLSKSSDGLPGKYWTATAVTGSGVENWKTVIGSYSALEGLWSGVAPGATDTTLAFGDTVNVRGSGDANAFAPAFKGADSWVAMWKGWFFAEADGTYRFASASDDGTSLFIDGELVVSNIADQGYNESQFDTHYGDVELAAGWHEIMLAFYDAAQGNEMTFRVALPGGEAQNLPNSLLFSSKAHGVIVEDFSAVAGTLELGSGNPSQIFDVDENVTERAEFFMATDNPSASYTKTGAGKLVVDSIGGNDGTFFVDEGTLELSTTFAAGNLVVADGATVSVLAKTNTDYRGLSLRYYDTSDNTYTQWDALDTLRTFFGGMTPTVTTNSYVFATKDMRTGPNPAYREPGVYSTGRDNYDFYMTGVFYAPWNGQYAFGWWSDDGVVLYLDGVKRYIAKGTCGSAVGNNTGWVTLSAGFHTYEYAFRENGGGQFNYTYLKLQNVTDTAYDSEYADWVIVPQNLFFPELSLAKGLSGTSGATLELGSGMLLVDSDNSTEFAGAVTSSAGGFLAKSGEGTLTISGSLASYAGSFAAMGGKLAIAPAAATTIGGDLVVEEGATLTIDTAAAFGVSGRLRGKGTLEIKGGATVTVANANTFEGTVLVKNGKFTATAANGTAKFSPYKLVCDPGENESAAGAVAGAANGTAVADLALDGGNAELADVSAVVSGADSVALLDGAEATIAAVTAVATSDYSLWSTNGVCEEWTSVDGDAGFLVIPGFNNKAGSTYLNSKIDVTKPWRCTYTYQVTKGEGNQWGDGTMLAIQNEEAGASFCDTTSDYGIGNKLGGTKTTHYTKTAGFWWDLYQKEACGWAVSGVETSRTVIQNNPADNVRYLLDGVDIEVSYDGSGVLSARVYHLGTLIYSGTQAIDMAATFGGGDSEWDGTAYIGFSGGSGGSSGLQRVYNIAVYAEPTAATAASVAVVANAHAAISSFTGADEFGELALSSGAELALSAGYRVPVDRNYTNTVDSLAPTGASTITIADNGTGEGTLLVKSIVAGNGTVTVSGGNVDAVDGELEVVVPNGAVPSAGSGRIDIMDFSASSWENEPAVTVVDEEGDLLVHRAFFRNGKLYLKVKSGFIIFCR